MFLYTFIDLKAEGRTGGIVACQTDGPIIRAFHDSLKAPDSPWAAHPEDYNLVCIGEIQEDGKVDGWAFVRTVATGQAWLAAQEQLSLLPEAK